MQMSPFVDLALRQIIAAGLTLAAGSFLQSAVGFGFGLFVMPLLLLLTDLPLPVALALMAGACLIQSSVSVYHLRSHAPWRRLLPLMAVVIVGLQAGVWVLQYVQEQDRAVVRQVVGGILLVMLTLYSLCKVRPQEQVHPLWGVGAFLVSGFTSGLAGMGGPPVVLWAMAHQWSGSRTRVSLLVVIGGVVPFQIWFMARQFGQHIWHVFGLGFVFVPLVLAGTAAGLWVGNRISRQRLRQIAMGMLILIALVSIVQPWLMGGQTGNSSSRSSGLRHRCYATPSRL